MARNERTGSEVSRLAAKVLADANATERDKALAGSALAQVETGADTSAEIAALAGEALRDPQSSEETRQLAASVLTQRTS